jgi:hypothetical protein
LLAVDRFLFCKLAEEESAALLLHLPKLYAENRFFNAAAGLGCRLVEAFSTSTSI